MNEIISFLLAIPLAVLLMGITVKFVLLCQAAREEEFAMRLEAVANVEKNSNARG